MRCRPKIIRAPLLAVALRTREASVREVEHAEREHRIVRSWRLGDRGALLAPEFASRVCAGANGVFKPLLVDGGQVVGTFRRTVTKMALRVALEPFGELTALLRAAFTRPSTRCGGLGREAHRA